MISVKKAKEVKTMEKYESPVMEIVDLTNDVILTSGGGCISDCPTMMPEL